MKVKFTKMQGAGNDYIYVNTFLYPLEEPERLSQEWSRPHTGIGSDGLVLIGPSEEGDFSMRIFNADGSEAMMCGNASRCIGKYVYENGLTQKTRNSDGFGTSASPSSRISNTPISLVEPKRFFTPRRIR